MQFARFFVIMSCSEDDVHKSIKYGVWASTDTGNRRLDQALAAGNATTDAVYNRIATPALGRDSILAGLGGSCK